MPVDQYDAAFGGKPGSARKALSAMLKEYGQKRGTSVFYASVNKRAPGLAAKLRRRRRKRRR